MTQFWIGGYGADMAGDADGIGVLSGDAGREPGTLAFRGTAVKSPSPSWLVAHPTQHVLYAALEGSAQVRAYARTGIDSLRPFGRPVDAGESVCHLAVAPDGSSLLASCYGDGRVVRFELGVDGALESRTVLAAAVDPYSPDAQPAAQGSFDELMRTLAPPSLPEEPVAASPSGFMLFDDLLFGALKADEPEAEAAPEADPGERVSRAHAAAFLPDGRVATTDLGFDLVRIWRPSARGLVLDHEITLPFGVGPRHMVVHPSGHVHVVTEYSGEVFTLAAGRDGRWALRSVALTSPAVETGVDFAAELTRSADGHFLYAGLRGSNTIAVLRVRDIGDRVEPIALVDSGVNWPRHHLVHDGSLLVAGQRSDEISVLDIDERTGIPGRVRHTAAIPSPTHLLLARE